MSIAPLVHLARSPRAGVDLVLARGSMVLAVVLIALTSVASALSAMRVAADTDVNALFFAETRQPWVQTMIDTLGPDATTVLLYLVERSIAAVLVATAISPLFVWLLGSSAIHASARLAGITRPYLPLLVLFAYATAIALVPASLATLILGAGPTVGARVASAIGWICLLWLGVIAHRGIVAHYGVSGDRALRILLIAVVLFYIFPLLLIIVAAVSIIVAAGILEYF